MSTNKQALKKAIRFCDVLLTTSGDFMEDSAKEELEQTIQELNDIILQEQLDDLREVSKALGNAMAAVELETSEDLGLDTYYTVTCNEYSVDITLGRDSYNRIIELIIDECADVKQSLSSYQAIK